MTDRHPEVSPFRFGVVTPFGPDVAGWTETVRRIAGHGYSTVLMPDFPRLQPAPAAALAVAATVADVRVAPRCMPPRYVGRG